MSPFLTCFTFRTILLGPHGVAVSLVLDWVLSFATFFWFCPQEVQKITIKNNAYTCSYFIIYLLSNRLCEGHVYKLFYYLVLHNRPILLDMNTWVHAIHYGFL